VAAIDKPIEGQDIIAYFRSFAGSVCQEHMNLLIKDKERGVRVGCIGSWVTVGKAIDARKL
jgi:hypothetical protein